ncbi:Hypothetical predicted protein [Olea europaea subsp. europaea]|uniref:Uncharacterized protein n=1 Tax=Olea europaea subsp. europaea TaxID=158383 RepID=A0A8S0PMA6_OLEEU|nr:Hypothetical predicted protein [Olea europaea subsp. europaea]
MQSGAGAHQDRGGGGHGSASPSSSSSAVSAPQLAFDQQQQARQSLQQQFLRRPEGNEALLAHQAGKQGSPGGFNFSVGIGSMQLPQQSRNINAMAQLRGPPNIPEQGRNRSQDFEQQMLNPIQQAYFQRAFQASQQKSGVGMQSQHQMTPGMFGPHGTDQEMRTANMRMQELLHIQVANQSQASSSKKSSEQIADQPMLLGPTMPVIPMQGSQAQQNIMKMTNNPNAMAAQLQAMQALALERNIDLSNPVNANMMAQLIPLLQSGMVAQQKANESNPGLQPESVAKQQVNSPQVANESSPHGNSSSDLSGQSGSYKARQLVSTAPLSVTTNSNIVKNPSNISVPGRDNQLPPRQATVVGNGMLSTHPADSSVNLNQRVDNAFLAKKSAFNIEASQGLSEEEVRAAAACAREEVMIRNRFSEMNAPKDSSSVNK